MPNSNDFRSTQIQTNKLIVTGSNADSTQCLLVYGHSAQGTPGEQGIINQTYFPTDSIGADTFVFFSGAVGSRGSTNPGVVAFGGDLHISGNLTVDGTVPVPPTVWFSSVVNQIFTTGSVEVRNITASDPSLIVTGSAVLGGLGSYATGSSVAQGEATTASGVASHSQGQSSTASGDYSHAEGFNGTSSGTYSHAEGSATIATATAAHAEGSSTTASGVSSHAEGDGTTASGMNSHAEGDGTTASGDASHAEGDGTTASGMNSHAEGISTFAMGTAAHAEGNFAFATGDYSHAEGNFTFATGYAAHAEGSSATASGIFSHAEGSNTFSIGEFSHAEGIQTYAFGTGSFAAGLGTVASGAVDGVFPTSTTQAAFGKYNVEETDALFVVGDGSDTSNRHDVFRVRSGSVEVTGSFVCAQITGSLSGTLNGSPFVVAGSNISANYNSLGQWEITGSFVASEKTIPVLAGVATTVLSASTAIGYAQVNSGSYSSGSLEAIGFGVVGVTGSLELYDLTDAAVAATLQWTEASPTHKSASFVAPATTRIYELRSSKTGGGPSDYALFSGVFLVMS